MNLEQSDIQQIEDIVDRWEQESAKTQLLKYFEAFELFIDSLALEDYIAETKASPKSVSTVSDLQAAEDLQSFELLKQLAHEVAVLEFKVMFKRVSADLGQ